MKPKQGDGSKWVCEFGCDQAASLKKTGKGCVHLERLIGSPRAGESAELNMRRQMEQDAPRNPEEEFIRSAVAEEGVENEPHDTEKEMRANMRRLKIPYKSAEVVILRVLHGYSFQEIAEELGYAHKSGALNTYNRVIDQLKNRGYGKD